ncbi:hypothetical protein DF186_15480, partial [Enterococcus hirae]
CDADSISYFDNNVENYLKRKGHEETRKKIDFMFYRASHKAQRIINDIVDNKPNIKDLMFT